MSNDAIFTVDVGRRITSWSATAARLFGRAARGALDSPFEAMFPEHLQREIRTVTNSVFAGERVMHFETEVVRDDGMPVPICLSLRRTGEFDDAHADVLVIARDLTEQQLAQAMLEEVEVRLAEGEALAHVGSWLWDLRTGTVQWSNEFHRIHGIDPLDFDGTLASHLQVVHPEDRGLVQAEMERAVDSRRPFERAYRIVRPDQEVRIVRVRAQPIFGSTGAAVGLRGIGQDVGDARPATAHSSVNGPRPPIS
jgi:PAS domain S-box-containing protein